MSNYVDGNLSIDNTTKKTDNKCDGQEGKNELIKKMSLYSTNSRAVILKCFPYNVMYILIFPYNMMHILI